MIVLMDNDIMQKLARCHLLAEAMTCFQATSENVRRGLQSYIADLRRIAPNILVSDS